jgi:hypothetical protein
MKNIIELPEQQLNDFHKYKAGKIRNFIINELNKMVKTGYFHIENKDKWYKLNDKIDINVNDFVRYDIIFKNGIAYMELDISRLYKHPTIRKYRIEKILES